MMKAFAYRSPKTVDQAVAALGGQWGKVALLAGGTDLLALMKDGLEAPETVVSLKGVDGLGAIAVTDSSIKIGAGVTLDALARHAAVQKHLPALAAAAAVIGGAQIRNMGTVGGNLCQRSRDWYFRTGVASKERAESQYGAIFPMNGQNHVAPSTLAPALIAYGAEVEIAGTGGGKKVPVEGFFQVSDLAGKRETILAPNEIVTGINVPVKAGISADYEVRERQSHDWPLVQVSVALTMAGASVSSARIVLGHVAPVPLRSKEAEAAITGKAVTMEAAAAAAQAAAQGAKPTAKNGYKVQLLQVAVKRALLSAAGNQYWRS